MAEIAEVTAKKNSPSLTANEITNRGRGLTCCLIKEKRIEEKKTRNATAPRLEGVPKKRQRVRERAEVDDVCGGRSGDRGVQKKIRKKTPSTHA